MLIFVVKLLPNKQYGFNDETIGIDHTFHMRNKSDLSYRSRFSDTVKHIIILYPGSNKKTQCMNLNQLFSSVVMAPIRMSTVLRAVSITVH